MASNLIDLNVEDGSGPVAGTTARIKIAHLRTYHRNAREGDVEAIVGSLLANGQFKPIVVNIGTHTGRPGEVLAGNHTLKAFRELSERNPFDATWSSIAAHFVDVDEDMATRIVLADNRTSQLGDFDADALLALLNDVGTTGTGYTDADLDELEDAWAKTQVGDPDPPDENPPAPDFGEADAPVISYTLTFDDPDQQDAWFAFVKWLKETYPSAETVSERLIEHLQTTAWERG